jgi:hypothetical protein
MSLVIGLAVVFALTGCDTQNFCGANPVLSFVFCRADADSTPGYTVPGYTVPTAPEAPKSSPYARIDVSDSFVTIVQSVGFDGIWSDSDGRVTKFEWDLDGDGAYEIHGTPTASNRDHRSRTFTEFGYHTVRLRVTDNDGLVTAVEERVYVDRRVPTAVLVISPDAPTVGQQVTFDASGSSATDTNITGYVWDIDGIVSNGYEVRTTAPTVTRTYDAPQTIEVGVRALDDYGGGHYGQARRSLTIGPAPRSLSMVAAPSAAVRLFSARLDARPVPGHPGQVQRRGVVQSLRGMLVTGRFNGKLARARPVPRAEALLGKLLRAGYRARVDASVNARTRRSTTTMLALATITRGSVACLRITIAEGPGRKPSGSFSVLGGTGAVTRLSATGTFGFTPGQRTPSTLTGRVKARLSGPRGLPRACVALR